MLKVASDVVDPWSCIFSSLILLSAKGADRTFKFLASPTCSLASNGLALFALDVFFVVKS